MCAVGVAAASTFAVLRADRIGYDRKNIAWFIVSALVGLIIGSKLVFFISRLPYLAGIHAGSERYIEELVEAGYVFFGGVLGAYAGLIVRCKVIRASLHPVLNFFTPAFAFFHGFGRIGCFCAGCCYGIEVEHFGFVVNDVRRFPVQLVESAFEFLMFFALLCIEKKMEQKKKSPKLSFYYLMTYSFVRFNLEFLRGDAARGFFGPLSTSQWIALIIIISGIVSRIVPALLKRRGKSRP